MIHAMLLGLLLMTGFKNTPDSPAGLILNENIVDNNRTWYFCPNGNVQMIENIFPEKSIYQGVWKLEEGILLIEMNVHYGKRGIGEPWIYDSKKGYNEYADYVQQVNEVFQFEWPKIVTGVGEEHSPFSLVKQNYQCPVKYYTPQLPGKYPVASYRLLTEKDLNKYSVEELTIMSKEIYARYGYKFIGSSLEYFMQQDWYFPVRDSIDDYLTIIEKRNISTIAATIRRKK